MYKAKIGISETQQATQLLKDSFSLVIQHQMNLIKVPGPLFVNASEKLNDTLSDNTPGVMFKAKCLNDQQEIVQSLAKWKRMALKKYDYPLHSGLVVDMKAIRSTEFLDATHSLLVDQWDWEYIIDKSEANLETLKKVVDKFYYAVKSTEDYINVMYSELEQKLPNELFYISSEELYKMYPDKTASEREYLIVKEHKAVFITQVGGEIPGSNGQIHDTRAKDYDNLLLNGDLLVYHKVNDSALELMSMGIRVDREALIRQTGINPDGIDSLPEYYQLILKDELPRTIGGGLGQSRLAMFLLEKTHIGEVQVSSWDKEYLEELAKQNIHLL